MLIGNLNPWSTLLLDGHLLYLYESTCQIRLHAAERTRICRDTIHERLPAITDWSIFSTRLFVTDKSPSNVSCDKSRNTKAPPLCSVHVMDARSYHSSAFFTQWRDQVQLNINRHTLDPVEWWLVCVVPCTSNVHCFVCSLYLSIMNTSLAV